MNNPSGAKTRAVAYIRVSTDKQAEQGLSLEAQRQKVTQYATLYDIEIVDVIVDAASAKSLDRPGLELALGLLSRKEANAVLVTKLDRLTRSVKDLGFLLENYFQEHDNVLLAVNEQVDTRTAAGRMVLNILMSVAQWERETIGERTRDALAELKTQNVQLGQRRIEQLLPPEILLEIRKMHANGLSQRRIVEELNRRQVPTARGRGKWGLDSVQRALKAPIPVANE